MAEILVVADDLTGANACAAGFSREGLRTVTVGLDRKVESITAFHGQFDVVVATTESRHSEPLDAARAVRASVAAGWPVKLACARIDTTLRGNVGVAAQALIDSVAELAGRRTVGLCVPAFPQADRVTVDGQQLLGGKRLEDTELAHDVRSPVTTSDVADILRTGTMLSVAHVPMSRVIGGHEDLVSHLTELMADPAIDVIVGDALTVDHIETLARAAVQAASQADVSLVSIDPGPASLACAQAMGLTDSTRPPILAVSGSSTDLTIRQLRYVRENRDVAVVEAILDGDMPDVEKNVVRLADELGKRQNRIVLWASVLSKDDIRPITREQGDELPRLIGEIVRKTLESSGVEGLYTTGGDITAAVLDSLGARGIEVEDEVLPLAVMGTIVGGGWQGTPIVTKGGLIGDDTGAAQCIDYMDHVTAQRGRWVRTIPETH